MKHIKRFKMFEEAPPMDMDKFDIELGVGFTPQEQEKLKQLGADEVSKDVAIFVESYKNNPGQSYQIRCQRMGAEIYKVEAGEENEFEGRWKVFLKPETDARRVRYNAGGRMSVTVKTFSEMLQKMADLKSTCDYIGYGKFNEMMNREKFIKWLETETDFERKYDRGNWDVFHRMDYKDYNFDEVEVDDNVVIFSWQYRTLGHTEDKKDEYTFDEFVDRYKKDTLK